MIRMRIRMITKRMRMRCNVDENGNDNELNNFFVNYHK